MPNPSISYYSALIGAFAAIVTGFLLEAYKRHKDRQGIASALLGEIKCLQKGLREAEPSIKTMNLLLAVKNSNKF